MKNDEKKIGYEEPNLNSIIGIFNTFLLIYILSRLGSEFANGIGMWAVVIVAVLIFGNVIYREMRKK